MIRSYHWKDWNEVEAIYNLAKPDEMKGIVASDQIVPLSHDGAMLKYFFDSEILVYEMDGKISGFAGRKNNIISWLFVHPDHRREGIARALIERIIEDWDGPLELNVARTNQIAIDLYRNFGFAIYNEFTGSMYGKQVPAVRMRRPFARSDSGTDDILIRRIGPGDETVLQTIVSDIKDPEQRRVLTEQDAHMVLSNSKLYLLTAFNGDAPVGFAIGYRNPRIDRVSDMMNFYEIEVLDGFRGRGVGRKLVEALKELCVSEGIMKMWVDTNLSNKAAVGLYTATGARRVSPDSVQFGWVFK